MAIKLVLTVLCGAIVELSSYEELKVFGQQANVAVLYVAPGCPHSERAVPNFELAAASWREDSVAFAIIDGTISDVVRNQGVDEYPFLAAYQNSSVTQFTSDFSVASIDAFLHSVLSRIIHFKSKDSIEEWWSRRVSSVYARRMTLMLYHGPREIGEEDLNFGTPGRDTFYGFWEGSNWNGVEVRHGDRQAEPVFLTWPEKTEDNSFLKKHNMPLFQEISVATYQQYMSDDVVQKGGFAAICVPKDVKPPPYTDVEELATFALDHNVRLGWINTSVTNFNGCRPANEFTGIVYFLGGPRQGGKSRTALDSSAHFNKWLMGTLTSKHGRSSQESIDESGLHRMSSASLMRDLNTHPPALILITHSTISKCETLMTTLAQRARKTDISVGILDSASNDLPENLPDHLRWTKDQVSILVKPLGTVVHKLAVECSEMAVLRQVLNIDPVFSVLEPEMNDEYKELREWLMGKKADLEVVKKQVIGLLDFYAARSDVDNLQNQLLKFLRFH